MPNALILISITLPLLMTAAAIATIHNKRKRERSISENTWRDTSLDDWRKERDAQIELERQQRVSEPGGDLSAGRAEEGAEPVKQQRIGG